MVNEEEYLPYHSKLFFQICTLISEINMIEVLKKHNMNQIIGFYYNEIRFVSFLFIYVRVYIKNKWKVSFLCIG